MTECSTSPPTKQSLGYIGRFAPSPTGLLHYGSLLTAVASWLHARQHQGQWIIRIEDLDPPREQAGASDAIIRTLANWGMESDQTIWFQSQRLDSYQQQIESLLKNQKAYRCYCSRKQVAAARLTGPEGYRYNGHCRQISGDLAQQHSIRFNCSGPDISFIDELQGHITENPEQLYGDFPIKRADGYIAYQLATVMDDAAQHISHVVRGIDLLSSTSRQIGLQKSLNFSTPGYCHLPVVINAKGQKLSKQTFATPVGEHYSANTLTKVLNQLGLDVPNDMTNADASTLLNWAIAHWNVSNLAGKKSLLETR